jgi:hypothetical protein
MATSAVQNAAETMGRLAGERPGRLRSLLVAAMVGVGSATLTYKLLRSGGDEESEGDEEPEGAEGRARASA